jgi:hypothetical protein
MAREFEWDERTQRYRVISGSGKGQFITKEAITTLQGKAIAASGSVISKYNKDYFDGGISLQEWQTGIVTELRDLHLQAYALGAGGWENLTDADYANIKKTLDSEMVFFDAFSKEIADGKLSNAQIEARSQMYASRLNNVYENGRLASHIKAGYKTESRHRTVTESCEECIEYELAGIVEINTLPNPGEACRCRSNCKCYKQYYKTEKGQSLLNELGSNKLFIRYG